MWSLPDIARLFNFSSIIVEGGEITPVDGPETSVLGSLDNIFRSVKDFDQVSPLPIHVVAGCDCKQTSDKWLCDPRFGCTFFPVQMFGTNDVRIHAARRGYCLRFTQ